jgi:nitrous oxidase accessory protein
MRYIVLTALLATRIAAAQSTLTVSPAGHFRRVADAIAAATPGSRIVVTEGVYHEPTIVVNKRLTIEGRGDAVLDGDHERQIMTIAADDVTVRGLHFRNVGSSFTEDRAAIKVVEATGCSIERNRIDDAFFAIYLAKSNRCRIAGNVIRGRGATETSSGNGIHLWTSREVVIENNYIAGHRDGIYFEFVHDTEVRRNVSERNLRYGLHFMYSDDCHYLKNTFRRNGSGVAVMYTKRVEMIGNQFEDNWGAAAYGLLLKEIEQPRLIDNRFVRNSIGLFTDGTTRLEARGNTFVDNGWAVKLMSSTQDGEFTANSFVGNTFDVATNSRESRNRFNGNYWDEYEGYDLDRDGVGDVPHHPVRLFSMIVSANEPSLILLRSLFVTMLDAAERVIPALTPEALVDSAPAMHRLP